MDGTYDKRLSVVLVIRGFEPIPWSAPHTSRFGGSKPNPRLVAWQDKIRENARAEFGPFEPWTGPISISATFHVKRAMPKGSEGKLAVPDIKFDELYSTDRLKHKSSDLTNLIKAAEDALERIVYVNDAQVCIHGHCEAFWSSNPGMSIAIKRIT